MSREFVAVLTAFQKVHKQYLAGQEPINELGSVSLMALRLLERARRTERGIVGKKAYAVLGSNGKESRPIHMTEFLFDSARFLKEWTALCATLKRGSFKCGYPGVNSLVYTAVQSFSCAIDLWKPGSRKTPGTFFEVAIGTFLTILTNAARSYQIAVPGETYRVPTDIVLTVKGKKRVLVIPTKITTRERIVQPFAHQRILNDIFPDGRYKTTMVCVSELQRQDDAVAEICVPEQVLLFQKHLAKLDGIYYLDPPQRYTLPDFTAVLPVKSFGDLVEADLQRLF